jgi:tetratricopeptide (TPR) repeat protein
MWVTGWRALAVLLALVAGLPMSTVAAQNRESTAQQYRSLLDLYRSGWTDQAVDQLLAVDQGAVAALVEGYVKRGAIAVGRDPALDEMFYRAASMLHAEAAFRCWDEGLDKRASTHFGLARGLVDGLDRASGAAGAFRRRWYLATALLITRRVLAEEAAEHFAQAVKRVPGDVPILVAAGWLSERQADLPAGRGWDLRTANTLRRRRQDEAVRYLTAALAVDARSAEASLRLARVESEMGRVDQAATRLSALVARDDLDRATAYVGRLVLGHLHERQGDAREAERWYREAMRLDPVAQSARVALGQLLHAAGDSAQAADVVEPMLTAGEDRERNDPWSDYRLAYPLVGQLIFEELRDEVQG